MSDPKQIKMACPHCGHTEFERIESVRVDIVEILQVEDDKGNKNLSDDVIDSGDTEYDYKCRKCNKNVTEEELKVAE